MLLAPATAGAHGGCGKYRFPRSGPPPGLRESTDPPPPPPIIVMRPTPIPLAQRITIEVPIDTPTSGSLLREPRKLAEPAAPEVEMHTPHQAPSDFTWLLTFASFAAATIAAIAVLARVLRKA